MVPLWQLKQPPMISAWSTRVTGDQALVLWQAPHWFELTM
jgi:hypothetical protein